MVLGHPYFSAYASRDRVRLPGIYSSVFEKLRFQLVFYPQSFKIYFENAL